MDSQDRQRPKSSIFRSRSHSDGNCVDGRKIEKKTVTFDESSSVHVASDAQAKPSPLSRFFKMLSPRSRSPKRGCWVNIEPQHAAHSSGSSDACLSPSTPSKHLNGSNGARAYSLAKHRMPSTCSDEFNIEEPLNIPVYSSATPPFLATDRISAIRPVRPQSSPPPVPFKAVSLKNHREALSEEDLVSKTAQFLNNTRVSETSSHSSPFGGPLVTSYSEESVFDPAKNVHSPSYIRVSCALSGYRNYRLPKSSITSPGLGLSTGSASPIVTRTSFLPPSYAARNSIEMPGGGGSGGPTMAKSIVEQRLAKFDAHKAEQNGFGVASASPHAASSVTTTDSATSTPVKNIVDLFNKLSLQDSSPSPVKPLGAKLQRSPRASAVSNDIKTEPVLPLSLQDDVSVSSTKVESNNLECRNGLDLTDDGHVSTVTPHFNALEKREKQLSEIADDYDSMQNGSLHDGTYYLALLRSERLKLSSLIAECEADITKENIPDEAAGYIRTALGKASLLMRKKLMKFEELCQKNLNPSPEEDQFPTLCADLDGYWQLVKMELGDVHSLFLQVDALRKNNWISVEDYLKKEPQKSVQQKRPPAVTTSTRPVNKEKDNARKQKLKELKAMALLRKQEECTNQVLKPAVS